MQRLCSAMTHSLIFYCMQQRTSVNLICTHQFGRVIFSLPSAYIFRTCLHMTLADRVRMKRIRSSPALNCDDQPTTSRYFITTELNFKK